MQAAAASCQTSSGGQTSPVVAALNQTTTLDKSLDKKLYVQIRIVNLDSSTLASITPVVYRGALDIARSNERITLLGA